MTRTSVREYAILYVGASRSSGGTIGGGNAILAGGQHDLEGAQHTAKPGALLVKREISPAALTAGADDWAPTGLADADVVRVSSDAAYSITGIDAPGVAYALLLENVGAFDLTLEHDSASSAAANRLRCPGGTDLLVPADGAVLLAYDATDTAWRVIGASGAGAVAVLEAGAPVLSPATSLDFRAGLYVRDLGSGVARIDGYGLRQLHSSCGAAETVDLEAGSLHDMQLDAATCAVSLTGFVAGRECGVTLLMRQDGAGGRLATWDAEVLWQGGVAPTLSTAPDAVDVLSFISADGGTEIYGFYGVVPPAPTELDDLTDVDTTTTPPGDGQALLWDNALGQWVPGNVATGSGSEVGSVLLIADGSADFLTTEDGTAFLSMG